MDGEGDREREKDIHYIYQCDHFLKRFLQFQVLSPLHGCIYPAWLYRGFIDKACSFIYTVKLEPLIGADQTVHTLLTGLCLEARHQAVFPMAV